MAKKDHDDLRKLKADTLNRIGLSCLSLGVGSPIVAAFLDLTNVPVVALIYTTVCFSVAFVAFHFAARKVLRQSDDERN